MVLYSVAAFIFIGLLCLISQYTLAQDTPPLSSRSSQDPQPSPPTFSQGAQASPSQATQSPQPSSTEPTEIYVWGEQPVSTTTEQNVRQKDFELRPQAHRSIFSPVRFPVFIRFSIRAAARRTSISFAVSMRTMELISQFTSMAFPST